MLDLFRKENIAKTLAPILLVVGLCFSLVSIAPPNASALPVPAPAAPAPASGDVETPGSEEEVTCAIEKIGWLLCPTIEWASDIGDKAFQMLANHFLETEPELVAATTSGRPSGTYIAWEMARNIANIMFVIAFLIIIYSQVTGAGLNNYGIKKLLPRLIIAVIAVNASYYICQAIVDLSNIMGYAIKDFLVSTSWEISDKSAMPVASASNSITQTHGVLKPIAFAILGAGAIVALLLPMLGVSILSIIIACLAIVIILMMRKAFIVLLVVLAPIAFVLYLLPNTERYFKKWASMFWGLLMVFPVVALLFGGGQIASAIVLIAGTQNNSNTTVSSTITSDGGSVYSDGGDKCIQLPASGENAGEATKGNCGTGSTPFMLGLTAALIAVAPLFAVWAVLKGALSAAGALGGKIGGTIQSIGDKTGRAAGGLENKGKKAAWAAGRDAAKYAAISGAAKGKFPGGRAGYDWAQNRRRRKDFRQANLDVLRSESDDASDLATETMKLQKKAGAGNVAQGMKAAEALAAESGIPLTSLSGQGLSSTYKNALVNQQSGALSEAVKNLEATIDSSDINELGRQLAHAFDTGNQVLGRAVQNAMLKSAPGQGMLQAVQNSYAGDTSGVMESLRQNALNNQPGLDDKWSAYADWSQQKHGGGDLADYALGGKYQDQVADIKLAKFATQGEHSKNELAGIVGPSIIKGLNEASNANMRAQFKGTARTKLGNRGVNF